MTGAQFAVRENASNELTKLGADAECSLQKAMQSEKLSAEALRRAGGLLKAMSIVSSPEMLRDLRAAQVLEMIGTPESRRVLEELAPNQAKSSRHAVVDS